MIRDERAQAKVNGRTSTTHRTGDHNNTVTYASGTAVYFKPIFRASYGCQVAGRRNWCRVELRYDQRKCHVGRRRCDVPRCTYFFLFTTILYASGAHRQLVDNDAAIHVSCCIKYRLQHGLQLGVSWSLTSLFSTNTAISETNLQLIMLV